MRFPFRFPASFGGDNYGVEAEHRALLDALHDGYETESGTEPYIETRGEAHALARHWKLNRRLANQLIPTRMLDVLVDWETAARMRPEPTTPTIERRKRLAAKLRGLVNNAEPDIDEAVSTALGLAFEAVVYTAEADEIVYWPGVNPGPPSYEWSSNRARLAVHANKNGLSEGQFRDLRQATIDLLLDMLPGWMTAAVGVGTGSGSSWIVGQGILGQTIL